MVERRLASRRATSGRGPSGAPPRPCFPHSIESSAAPSRARHPPRCASSRVSIAPRVTVATRIPMRGGVFHLLVACFLLRAVTRFFMGLFLAFRDMHRQTVTMAHEECAPPISSGSGLGPSPPAAGAPEPASRRRPITFSRTNFTYHQQGTRGTEIPFPLPSRTFARRASG